jgi:uncharacterized protein (DUF697 family)
VARLHPLAVFGLLKELRSAASEQGAVVVTGAPALADALRKELARGGQPDALRQQGLEEASALVYVLAAAPTDEDTRVLKQAHRERVPIVCVLAGPEVAARVPYVLATDIVRVPAGSGFPVDEIARALADRLGEDGTALAARLPALRKAVCERLIASFSRKAGVIGVVVFVPGADFPAITLAQLRLVLRIGAAHGVEIDRERLPEILAVIGSGLAFRAAARQALGFVPVAGWLVKGAIAYLGTRALGEAAVRYFAARTDGDGAVRLGS